MAQNNRGAAPLIAANGLKWAEKGELEKVPYVTVQMTDRVISSRDTGVSRHSYTAEVLFSRFVRREFTISSEQFGLVAMSNGDGYIKNQFPIKAKARVVKTEWPEVNGIESRPTYRLEVLLPYGIYLKSDMRDTDEWVVLFNECVEKDIQDFGKKYPLWVRYPESGEKATVDEAKADQ